MKQDLEQYMHHLESLDLPKAEKVALIEVVCSITERFVDLAFGCDPEQQVLEDKQKSSGHKITKGLGFNKTSLDQTN